MDFTLEPIVMHNSTVSKQLECIIPSAATTVSEIREMEFQRIGHLEDWRTKESDIWRTDHSENWTFRELEN